MACFRTPDHEDLVLFALNSARLRGEHSKEYGYVGDHRYKEMIAWALKELADAFATVIGVSEVK